MQVSQITVSRPERVSKKTKKVWKNPLRDTGYAAAAFGVASAVAGSKRKINLHKYFAYAAGLFTLAHIGIIEYYKHSKPKQTTNVTGQNS